MIKYLLYDADINSNNKTFLEVQIIEFYFKSGLEDAWCLIMCEEE